MRSKSIKSTSTEKFKEALQNSMEDGFQPTLAVIFLSLSHDIASISNIINVKNISIFGATAHGQFIDDEVSEKPIVALLMDMNPNYFKIYYEKLENQQSRESTKKIARIVQKDFSNPSFLILGCHLNTDGEELLRGFQDIIGTEVDVFGAMAGDDFTFADQYVFTNDFISKQAVVALAIDADKIKIRGRATCGWKPLSTEKTVTKSEGNRVYTIDNVTILEMTRKYSGLKNITKENKEVATEIAATFPLQLLREKGAPIMRPGLVVNWDDGSFICSGKVPQGAKVKFSLPPDFEALEEVIKECEYLKQKEMEEADALILFSCGGRLMTFGPLMGKEIEGIRAIWNVPIIGMFSMAELGRATDGNLEMHNLTTCCVALKEI